MLIKTMPDALEQAAVHLRAPSGRMKPFPAAADTDLARGQALFDAWNAAQAGEVVLIGPGFYDLQFKGLRDGGCAGLFALAGTRPLIRTSDHFGPLLRPGVAQFAAENVYLFNTGGGGSSGVTLSAGAATSINLVNVRVRAPINPVSLASTSVRLRYVNSLIQGIPNNEAGGTSDVVALRTLAGCEDCIIESIDSQEFARPNEGAVDAVSIRTGTFCKWGGLARAQDAGGTRCVALRANIVSGSNPVFDVGGGARLEAESGIANTFAFAGGGTWRFGDVSYDPAKIGSGAGLAVDFSKFTSTVKTLRTIDTPNPAAAAGTPGETVLNLDDGRTYVHAGGAFQLTGLSRIQDMTDFTGPPTNNHFVKFDGVSQQFVTAAIDIDGGILNIADAEDFSGSAVAGTMFHTGGAFITAGPTWDGTNSRVVFADNMGIRFGADDDLRIASNGTRGQLSILPPTGTRPTIGYSTFDVSGGFNFFVPLSILNDGHPSAFGFGAFQRTLYLLGASGQQPELAFAQLDSITNSVSVAYNLSTEVLTLNVSGRRFNLVGTSAVGKFQIGDSNDQVGLFGATPVSRPAAIADATEDLADVTSKLNALLAAVRSLGAIAS